MKSLLAVLLIAFAVTFAAAYEPYKEFNPYPLPSPDTCNASSTTSWLASVKTALNILSLGDRLITNATELLAYAEDYGHIYHRAPKAVYVPRSSIEVAALVQVAVALNVFPTTRFQIVVRGGSGNVQGATQTNCDSYVNHQVLLDTTLLNSVSVTGKSVWAGPGATFLSVVEAAADKKLRPKVVPDYLGLTIGGFHAIGGFGGDSVMNGAGVDQVIEAEVVTPTGSIVLARPGNPYFEAVRGGMGVFGVMTRVRLALEKNEEYTRIFHILTQKFNGFIATMDNVVAHHMPPADTIQSFAIPNDAAFYPAFVAPQPELDAVRANVDLVLAANQTYVYVIEIGVRTKSLDKAPTKADVAQWLAPGLDPALIFFTDYPTATWDNRLKLFTIPVLVDNGSWYARHPWGSFNFPATSLDTFEDTIQSYDPFLDSGFGLIALYPLRADSFGEDSFFSIPRSTSTFYHLTLGNTELTGTDFGLNRMAQNNRNLWNTLKAEGDASVYPTVYIPDFGPADWAAHFGAKWNEFRATKKLLDPFFIFADQRNFGFDSLY